MPLETKIGKVNISTNLKDVHWQIPNFFDLPQEYDSVIKSPHFRFQGTDCCMKVYPNGCKMHCSPGWFGIEVYFSDSAYRDISVGIMEFTPISEGYKSFVSVQADTNGKGLNSCFEILPTSFLISGKNSLVPGGNLYVFFVIITNEHLEHPFFMHLSREDVELCFSTYVEATRQTKKEIVVKKELRQNNDGAQRDTQAEKEIERPLQTAVGEISFPSEGPCWKIPNFYDLPQECDTLIKSPRFRFKKTNWYLEVYPNGCKLHRSSGWFGIGACNLNSEASLHNITLGIGVPSSPNRTVLIPAADFCSDGIYRYIKCLPTSFLKAAKDSLVPEGTLYVLLCNDEVDVAFENKQFLHLEKRDAVKGFSVFIEATRRAEEVEMQKLKKNLKDILLSGNISDIVLKVEGRDFKAHRCILAARSPVFLAMMMHETKEKISGVVDIPDVDAKTFAVFLNYLYTGNVENLTSENAVQLYTIADKYQVNELKKTCLDHMKDISADTFCDVITCALKYDETNLRETCIEFFAKNSLSIVMTSKWQEFLCENPITGNELFIKHLQLNK